MDDIGSKEDIKSRLKSYTPPWYGEDAIFQGASQDGFATAYVDIYQLLAYIKLQTRLATATDFLLDLAAKDFLNSFLWRGPGEDDDRFRKTLLTNILREKATRTGIAKFIKDYTGYDPIMFEPWDAGSIGGAYNTLNFAFDNPNCYWGGDAPYTGYITVFLHPINFKKLWGWNVETVGYNYNQEDAVDTLGVYLSADAFDNLLNIPVIVRLIEFFKCYGTRVLVEFREVENG